MIRRLLPGLLLLFLLSTGCETKVVHSYKLTDEQLAQLMLDMHLADVILPELPVTYHDSIKEMMWTKMEGIYKLPEEELKKEIEKLEEEPEKLKLIINRVKELADSIQ